MKKLSFYTLTSLLITKCFAQETVYPTPAQTVPVVITNATVHVGSGQVLNNTSVAFNNGKITQIGTSVNTPAGAKVVNAQGKHLYPGLILAASNLGLVEVPSVRATSDVTEIGEINPSVRSVVAYNTDSKVTNTLRANGILLANIVPQGGLVSGSSSVVQLDAWNWEDAVIKMDGAIHVYMPSLLPRPRQLPAVAGQQQSDPLKEGLEQIDRLKSFLQEAKAYSA